MEECEVYVEGDDGIGVEVGGYVGEGGLFLLLVGDGGVVSDEWGCGLGCWVIYGCVCKEVKGVGLELEVEVR